MRTIPINTFVKHFIALVFLFLNLISTEKISAQKGEIIYIGPPLGYQFRKLASSYGNLINAKIDISQEIQKARSEYFRAYKDGESLVEKEEQFFKLLLSKDIWYFQNYSMNKSINKNGADVLDFLTGKIDKGINPICKFAVERWAKDMEKNIRAYAGNNLSNLNTESFLVALEHV